MQNQFGYISNTKIENDLQQINKVNNRNIKINNGLRKVTFFSHDEKQLTSYNQTTNPMMPFQNFYPQSQFSMQPQNDQFSNQLKRKRMAEFAMIFRLQPIMTIINRQIPFDMVKQLDLKNCHLTQLFELDAFVSLQSLNVSNNQIEEIRHLTKLGTTLTSLNLSYNSITKIQNLLRLTQLKHLYLHNNKIEKIEGLQYLVGLVELSLGANQITKIKRINYLVNLQILGLQMNQIKVIEGIQNLRNLKLLTLGGNKIKKIQNLQTLDKLEILSLQDNEIQKIQNLYSMAKHLKQIRLQYNFIDELQQEFIIRQIALNGAQIIVSPKKKIGAAMQVVKNILPAFLK